MAGFGIFWNGAVAQFKVLFIFVKAWCWFFATFLSRETLYTIYFPNLRWKLLSYFFWIIITENLVWKLKSEPNFVDKLYVEKYVFGKIRCETKTWN